MSKVVDFIIEDGSLNFVRKLSSKQVDEWIAREWDRPDNPKHSTANFRAIVDACLALHPEGCFFVGNERSRVVYFDTCHVYTRGFTPKTRDNMKAALNEKVSSLANEYCWGSGNIFAFQNGHRNLDNCFTPMARFWFD